MNKNQISKVVVCCVAFICLDVAGCGVWAGQVLQSDTVDLAVEYNTGYPGHFVKMAMLMKNPVPISAFDIHITLGGPEQLVNFTTTDAYMDSLFMVLDTCPEPETVCVVDTCYNRPDSICGEWDIFPVRECYLDTVGSLINNFYEVSCHGDPASDTLPLPDSCKWVTVFARAYGDSSIPPRGNYDTLFQFGVDLSCICDADTDKSVWFLVSSGFSNLSNNVGVSVPFKFHIGEEGQLFAWWSVAGDASNDSTASSADVVFLINYLFKHGPLSCIPEGGDVDSNCIVNSADVVSLINYLFKHGPAPKRGCFCPQLQEARGKESVFELFENPNLKPLLERR
jgi:hypothetical protein